MNRMAGLVALAAALGCEGVPDGTVAFVNANVIPMDTERVLENHTVVVSEGRIARMGPSAEVGVPRGAELIDGPGLYLLPGFTEMHGHLPGPDAAPAEVDRILFLFLSNGVTTVRGMLGNASHLELRREIEAGTRLGPTLYVAGPPFRGSAELTVSAARRLVREQQGAGYDLLKILEGLPAEVYEAIAEEARDVGIPFGGHVPNSVGLLNALAAGHGSIDHLDNFLEALEPDDSPIKDAEASVRSRDLGLYADEGLIPHVVEATKIAEASVVPTMALWETFHADRPVEHYTAFDELKYLPRRTVDAWAESQNGRRERLNPAAGKRVIEIRKKLLKALRDAGVRIVFGTDAPQVFNVPGFSIHREMAIMESAGMRPYEILAAATFAAADHFGSAEFGRVAVGTRADLILARGNPLEDLKHVARPAGVMVRGRWMPESEIQAQLAQLVGSD